MVSTSPAPKTPAKPHVPRQIILHRAAPIHDRAPGPQNFCPNFSICLVSRVYRLDLKLSLCGGALNSSVELKYLYRSSRKANSRTCLDTVFLSFPIPTASLTAMLLISTLRLCPTRTYMAVLTAMRRLVRLHHNIHSLYLRQEPILRVIKAVKVGKDVFWHTP